MENELLHNINNQVKDVDTKISEGKELIKLLDEVGEDTNEFKNRFRELEKKTTKYRQALKSRGF
jgi:uncharacterized protein YoxC